MSFFGLTFLGAQDPFVGTTPLFAFEDSELIAAFDRVATGSPPSLSTATDLEAYVATVYHCPKGVPPPQDIVDQIRAWFPTGDIPKSQFTAGIVALKKYAEEDAENQTSTAWSKVCEYKSGLDLRAAKVKHTRMAKAPNEKYTEPLTDAQTMGWVKGPPVKTFPKKSCEETKFASAMIQSGVNYY
ncbi:unnamed protein product [Aphanomyces euteiches]|uniref:Uncharacterized protein n=1 Tax=Aphanomyces euteiches TaxID=100861 RepID=A0A6G0X6N8_9STRA|nr:hypothetical protein Ae201684_007969 [Aphanomyces euteiches]KAH9153155.1 hypothetical protein AeRB84_004532 [Aphanomyces euteiches]